MVWNKLYIVATCLALCFRASAATTPEELLTRCRETGLPILHIETVDSVMPTCDVAYPPEGCYGKSITNNEKIAGRLWIEADGDTIYDSGNYMEKQSGITIKVRGNTSATKSGYYGQKKPYKLKLQKKADLLFRGKDDIYADKDWILLRYVICETLTGNIANRTLQMPWTPAEKAVLLILNGDFRGMYLLTESVERNQNCRVNVSKSGFLYEYDVYWWNANYYIPSSNLKYNYTLKYPDEDDIKPWQEEYLTNSIHSVEEAIVTPDAIDNVLDVPSFARWIWVHDILGSSDAAGANVFITKYDTTATSKTAMACTWDFGMACANSQKKKWSRQHYGSWCFPTFFELPQLSFLREYIDLYDKLAYKACDSIANQLDGLRVSPLAAQMDKGQILDDERWIRHEVAPTKRLADLATYLRERKLDVDSMMTIVKEDYERKIASVNMVRKATIQEPVMCFDLLGRQVDPSASGITIIRYNDGTTEKRVHIQK